MSSRRIDPEAAPGFYGPGDPGRLRMQERQRRRVLRGLYAAFDRTTPWLAVALIVGGLGMAVLTAASATPWIDLFEFERADALLGAVAAWLAAAALGYQLGERWVEQEAE